MVKLTPPREPLAVLTRHGGSAPYGVGAAVLGGMLWLRWNTLSGS